MTKVWAEPTSEEIAAAREAFDSSDAWPAQATEDDRSIARLAYDGSLTEDEFAHVLANARAERDTMWVRRLDKANVCEACGVCLEPQPIRCKEHVHTEPGDPEWTYEP